MREAVCAMQAQLCTRERRAVAFFSPSTSVLPARRPPLGKHRGRGLCLLLKTGRMRAKPGDLCPARTDLGTAPGLQPVLGVRRGHG